MYVQRNAAEEIVGLYRIRQRGIAEERLAADHPEILAFRARQAASQRSGVSVADVVAALDQLAKATNIAAADRSRLDALLARLA